MVQNNNHASGGSVTAANGSGMRKREMEENSIWVRGGSCASLSLSLSLSLFRARARVRFTFARNAQVMRPRGIWERMFPVVSHRNADRGATRTVLRTEYKCAPTGGVGAAAPKIQTYLLRTTAPPIIMRRESNLWGPIADTGASLRPWFVAPA